MPLGMRTQIIALSLLLPCLSQAQVVPVEDLRERYPDALLRLEKARETLAAEHSTARGKKRKEVLEKARAALLSAIDQDLFPAWYGTRWEFYGATETPGVGAIACGYFVSTVLRDAGLKVERVKLAQQYSEWIVKTLVPKSLTWRFSNVPQEEVVARVRKAGGDGLYVVGLDYHVAFLRLDGDRADLCHSAVFEPVAVVCEPAATSAGMASGYHVVGKLFSDELVLKWLKGTAIPTWQPRKVATGETSR